MRMCVYVSNSLSVILPKAHIRPKMPTKKKTTTFIFSELFIDKTNIHVDVSELYVPKANVVATGDRNRQ